MSKKAAIPETPIRVLKVGTCPSLSGRSILTYHLGSNADSQIHLRIVQNSSSGQFNANWVSLEDIQRCLTQHPAGKPLTSAVLQPVFRGKSSNSPAFLFAALKAEGLVSPATEEDSGYLLGDIEAFRSEVSALVATDPVASDPSPEPLKRKRPARESSANTPAE
jgi:hypothetical protein